jgi:NADH-quinone oxidoreductase subunit N
LSVLQALVLAGGSVHISLAVFAVLMSLVGAFYYLRVVKVMYFDAPLSRASVSAPKDVQFVLSINALLLLLLGLLPGGLMTLCAEAILQMMGT